MASYIFGWQDPRASMYTSEKSMEYHALPMDGWKPWRWKVVSWSGYVINAEPTTVAENLTREQANGLVKLLEGVRDEQ